MALNTNLIMGFQQPKIESPLNQLSQVLQIQQAQQANKLYAQKADEYQRGVEDQNRLRQLMGGLGAGATDEQRVSALRGGGYFDQADKLEGGILTRQKTGAEVAKTSAEAKAKELEGSLKKLDVAGQTFGFVLKNPSLENAHAALDYLGANGIYTPELVAQYKAQTAANPASIPQLAETAFRSVLSAKDQLSKVDTLNAGDRQVTQSVDPVTEKVAQLGTQVIGQSADNKATTSASIENNKRTVGASLENAAATREVANATRDAAKIQTGFANEQGLRKEFEGLPEVKNYKQAYPAYAAVKDSVGRNTPQSDINLVYAIAKLYDPNSVVREGEYATVANSPNIPERIKGYAQYLAGGGRLSPETKKQILDEATGRMGTYEAEARKAKGSYEGIAKKRGMDPASVFADMGDMTNTKTATPTGTGFKYLGTE